MCEGRAWIRMCPAAIGYIPSLSRCLTTYTAFFCNEAFPAKPNIFWNWTMQYIYIYTVHISYMYIIIAIIKQKYVYNIVSYIYQEPKWPPVSIGKGPCFGGLFSPKNRGHLQVPGFLSYMFFPSLPIFVVFRHYGRFARSTVGFVKFKPQPRHVGWSAPTNCLWFSLYESSAETSDAETSVATPPSCCTYTEWATES